MDGSRRFHVENLHSQIADDLIRQIASGALVAGSPLPSEADLASKYGVAPNTLRRALDHLAELELVERRKGRQTTVGDIAAWRRINKLISTVDSDGNRVLGDFEQRNARVEMPPPTVSDALHHRIPRVVLRFDRLRFHLGRCFMVEDVFAPMRHQDLQGDQKQLDQIAREVWWNREAGQAKREKLWLETANEADIQHLGLRVGQSVLCIERIVFGARSMPLEYRLGRCNFGTDLYYLSD